MNDQEPAPPLTLARLLRLTLDTLAYRVRLWATLVISAALLGYAAWQPVTPRIVVAVLFTLMVHVPLWWRDKGESK